MLENFENHEFLNGQNFSKIADVVFTLNVPNEDLSNYNIEDYKIITKNTEFTGLKIRKSFYQTYHSLNLIIYMKKIYQTECC